MKTGRGKIIAISILLLIATFGVIFTRLVKIGFESGDIHRWVGPWYDYFVKNGQINAFSDNFYNYTPAYLYLISFISLFSWIPKLIGIKLISFIFDISAAIACYKIIFHKTNKRELAVFSFFVLLLLPTVFIESGIWGQCDIIFTSFLLWMLYALQKGKRINALIFFSIAFTFKLQAIFVAPIFVILVLSKKINWYFSFLVPLIYGISILIPLIEGRALLDLLSIYFSQAETYSSMSMNAPNPYYLLARINFFDNRLVISGVILTAIVILLYLLFRIQKDKYLNNDFWIYDLGLLSLLIPFLLPKMHERYFFPAAIFLVILSFIDKKMIIPAMLFQVSSLLSYFNFLLNIPIDFTLFAFWINLITVYWVTYHYFKTIKSKQNAYLNNGKLNWNTSKIQQSNLSVGKLNK